MNYKNNKNNKNINKSVDKIIEKGRNVDKMFDLIHTYILVLLKKYKNKYFVNNFIGAINYIDTGPFYSVNYNYGKELNI